MELRKPTSIIQIANEKVSILYVCKLIGMDVPYEVAEGRSVKVRCPFGELYHNDGGIEKSFRIYPDTNSAFDFSKCGYFSPVWLYAQATDKTSWQSAEHLLNLVGYTVRVNYDKQWSQAIEAQEEKIDISMLRSALDQYCHRIFPGWTTLQFEEIYSNTYGKCINLLNLVSNGQQASEWLETSKLVMSRLRNTNE